MRYELTPEKKYALSLLPEKEPIFEKVRKEMIELGRQEMALSDIEATFLQVLIHAIGIKKIVEVGTFLGHSALMMAKALPKDGQIFSIEYNPTHAGLARGFFQESPWSKQLTLLEGKGQDRLKDLESKGPFDLVFIDADKGGYDGYLTWAESHVKKGGLIIGDNTFLFGEVYLDRPREVSEADWKSMRSFNKRLSDPSRYRSVLVPTDEGMTVAVKLY